MAAFLDGKIGFEEIPVVIEDVVTETPAGKSESIYEVLRVDQRPGTGARERVARLSRTAVSARCVAAKLVSTMNSVLMYNAFRSPSVAIVLGFMILIHEFGHYAVAKCFGVRVEQFSIGFGKRLVGFRKGETDYRISAMPLGGYVKMVGENPMDRAPAIPGSSSPIRAGSVF